MITTGKAVGTCHLLQWWLIVGNGTSQLMNTSITFYEYMTLACLTQSITPPVNPASIVISRKTKIRQTNTMVAKGLAFERAARVMNKDHPFGIGLN